MYFRLYPSLMTTSMFGRGGPMVLALLVLTTAASAQPEDKLLSSDGTGGDLFGASVSISDDRVVVGAFQDHHNGVRAGSAYVFHFDGTSWTEESKLLPSDGAADDFFGASVSISGDRAVVGAFLDDDNGESSGSAYVFHFDGTSWREESKLLPSDGAKNDRFGNSVSISGDRAVVGAIGDDDNGESSGSAYVFRYNGTSWREESKLLASDGAADDFFGRSVSISGDRAVVGATGDQHNGESSGSAYVFHFDGTSWREESKLLPRDGAAGDRFGNSVSISGDRAVVGAILDDDNGESSGSAYVFRLIRTTWTEESKLLPSDGAADDLFAASVSISGGLTVVGAHRDSHNSITSGSAYVFHFDGTSWREEQKLLASDRARDDFFGVSVSISGGRAAVGAERDSHNLVSSGSAYIYDLSSGAVYVHAVDVGMKVSLGQNSPNPVTETATISYDLPRVADVTLTAFDVLGRTVRELVSDTQSAGAYLATFDATGLPSGVYFYRLQAGDYVETKRMVVVK